MKITVSCARKMGMPEYSSLCASVELTVDFDPTNPAPLADQIRAVQHIASEAVEAELCRQLGEIGRSPAPAPAPARNGQSNGAAVPGRISRSLHSTKMRGDRAPSVTLRDDRPKSGREMYPWSKNQESRGVTGLVKFLESFGSERGFPLRFTDWSRDEVDAGYEAALAKYNPEN